MVAPPGIRIISDRTSGPLLSLEETAALNVFLTLAETSYQWIPTDWNKELLFNLVLWQIQCTRRGRSFGYYRSSCHDMDALIVLLDLALELLTGDVRVSRAYLHSLCKVIEEFMALQGWDIAPDFHESYTTWLR